MGSVPEKRAGSRRVVAVFAGLFVLTVAAWLATPTIVSRWAASAGFTGGGTVGVFADQFAVVGCLFAALAFLALVYSLYQQGQELRLQREELHLQRLELRRSVAEMAKSADAQTAQVRINTLAAMLASLPLLIEEEQYRAEGLDQDKRLGLSKGLGLLTTEEVVDKREGLTGWIARKRAQAVKEQADLQDKPETAETAQAKQRLEGQFGLLDRSDLLANALDRLIAFRQELADTYEQMKTYQGWKVPNSDTSAGTGPGDDAAQG